MNHPVPLALSRLRLQWLFCLVSLPALLLGLLGCMHEQTRLQSADETDRAKEADAMMDRAKTLDPDNWQLKL